jgi:hypothetical protein
MTLTQRSNAICKINHSNNNPYSPIDSFKLITVRDYSDYHGSTFTEEIGIVDDYGSNNDTVSDPYYRLYGITRPLDKEVFIGEFYNIDHAMNLLYNLTGNMPQLISY